ncbi:MAG: hypothetical protein Q9216_005498 [Gyalolechia sp. 2 TL-2023]
MAVFSSPSVGNGPKSYAFSQGLKTSVNTEVAASSPMDPISVSASILGILGAAAKVSEVLTSFIHGVKDAPRLARNVIAEVEDLSLCLQRLQDLILSERSTATPRKSMIMVDQLCVVLTHTVMTFSELEDTLEGLKPRSSLLFSNRLKWIAKEPTISKLLQRLQSSKLSLNLVLTTLSCAGLDEAQQSIQSLTEILRNVIVQNQKICRRLERSDVLSRLKHQSAPPALESASCGDDDTSTLKPSRNSCGHDDLATAVERRPDYAFSFEQDLRQSRVYTRVSRTIARRSDPDSLSLPSSASCSMGSSFLSGLSLADVSNISLVSLPIAPCSLSNGQRYRESSTKDLFPTSYIPHKLHPIPRSSGKILLLGISNAGKSTVLKQLQLMQGIIPTPIELEEARTVIRAAVIDTFRRALSEYFDQCASDNPIEGLSILSRVSKDADKAPLKYATQSYHELQYSCILDASLKDTTPQEEYFDGALVVFSHLWKQEKIKWAINAKPWPQTPNNIP